MKLKNLNKIHKMNQIELIWHSHIKTMRRKSHKLLSEDLEPGK